MRSHLTWNSCLLFYCPSFFFPLPTFTILNTFSRFAFGTLLLSWRVPSDPSLNFFWQWINKVACFLQSWYNYKGPKQSFFFFFGMKNSGYCAFFLVLEFSLLLRAFGSGRAFSAWRFFSRSLSLSSIHIITWDQLPCKFWNFLVLLWLRFFFFFEL